ncbi:unnamed protein product [Pylaiella littoralis]
MKILHTTLVLVGELPEQIPYISHSPSSIRIYIGFSHLCNVPAWECAGGVCFLLRGTLEQTFLCHGQMTLSRPHQYVRRMAQLPCRGRDSSQLPRLEGVLVRSVR